MYPNDPNVSKCMTGCCQRWCLTGREDGLWSMAAHPTPSISNQQKRMRVVLSVQCSVFGVQCSKADAKQFSLAAKKGGYWWPCCAGWPPSDVFNLCGQRCSMTPRQCIIIHLNSVGRNVKWWGCWNWLPGQDVPYTYSKYQVNKVQ